MMLRPAVVVLAAGKGSRFLGENHKLAQTLHQSTVLGHTLCNAIASDLPVIVVTTAALAEAACRNVAARDVILLPEVGSGSSELGMGFSIRTGVLARPHADGWLVLPADMPQVSASTLQAVAQELAQHPVAYAQHKGLRGHPVGFSAEMYSELISLGGDEGARRLVARYPAHGVEVDDEGVLIDVDTLADLEKLRRRAPVLMPAKQKVSNARSRS